jgi:hypothetical protein
LIQPFKRPLSTCTQSASLSVTLKRMPLRAVPRTVPLADGVDLMFTPGRCKKTTSGFSHGGTLWRAAGFPVSAAGAPWGEASTVKEGGRSGQATALFVAGDGSGIILGATWSGATAEDCTAGADSAVCVGVFSPADAKKKYASAATPNVAAIAVPAITFRRDPRLVAISRKSLLSGRWKRCSFLGVGPKASCRRRISAAAGVSVGASGGAQNSGAWSRLVSANLSPLSRASVEFPVAMLPQSQGGLQSHCTLGLTLITLSVAYLDTRSDPNSSIAVPHRSTASPVAVWNVYGYRFSVVHRRRTSRRYPKKRAQCQSTKQGRYKIVPRCRLLRRDASKRYGNCTARNRNPLHAPSKVTP